MVIRRCTAQRPSVARFGKNFKLQILKENSRQVHGIHSIRHKIVIRALHATQLFVFFHLALRTHRRIAFFRWYAAGYRELQHSAHSVSKWCRFRVTFAFY